MRSKRLISGFTLIELLSVVAVTGTLAALVMAGLNGVRTSANRTKCVQNVRQIATAAVLYAQDHDGLFPDPIATIKQVTGQNISGNGWDVALTPYLSIEDFKRPAAVFKCPVDPRPAKDATTGKFARSYCFSGINAEDGANSLRGLLAGNNPDTGERYQVVRKLGSVTNPSDTIMIYEAFSPSPYTGNYQYYSGAGIYAGWKSGTGPVLANGKPYHGTVMNFGFVDGHVESASPVSAYSPVDRFQAIR